MSMYDHKDRDNAYNEIEKVTLADGQKATIRVQPRGRVSEFFLRTVAISKYAGTTYTVEADGRKIFDNEPIPPTDPDAGDSDTFTPPKRFETEAVIVIKNASGSSHDYLLQLEGWERRRTVDQSESVPWGDS